MLSIILGKAQKHFLFNLIAEATVCRGGLQGSQQLGFVPSCSEFECQLGMLGLIAILVVLLGFCHILPDPMFSSKKYNWYQHMGYLMDVSRG